MMEFSVRVMIADDHPALLLGIEYELEKASTVQLVGKALNSTELIAVLDEHPCDVLVSDYAMPGGDYGDGTTLFSFIQRRYPDIRLVVLTMVDNPGVVRLLLTQGISCILSKSDTLDHLVAAINAAYVNGKYFSPTIASIVKTLDIDGKASATSRNLSTREGEVVRLFIAGLTINEIAERLHRSKKTVSSQKMNAMRKLGIQRDADLIKYGAEANMAPATDSPVA
ncbi:MAG: response regulator transcription factor [Collimonas sp.]|uniref:response regulator transcription factor n=1 Tax=Collimonas sp. TaxID=1963772 RepID=UPI00326499F4